jgi:glutathione S-transferase
MIGRGSGAAGVYRVHGMVQSYFTRKMTGYLDYKGIPWAFRRFAGTSPEAMAAGFPGGMPVVQTPDGEFMWDSTAMIHHLELRFPEPAVLPADPVQRFICYVLEDAADEWLYRPAVGTRWHFPENAAVGGFELARDATVRMPLSADQAHAGVAAHVLSSCGPLGVSADTIQCWVDDVLRPWQRVVGEHLARRPYLLGERPSLADFAFFGGNAAHFANDPLCRRWTDEDAPAVVQHTHRLLEPDDQAFGAWDDPAAVSETLTAVLAELGRRYLPWVSRACADGVADVVFENGARVAVHATDFLRDARATLLARYVESRSARLDDVLERAGILPFFADHVAFAGSIPDVREPPRPALNRPFPPAGE